MKWRRRRYTKKPHPGRTAVYQFRDTNTQAYLYVGITNNIERRFNEHAGLSGDEKKWWWDQVDHRHVTVTWYPTRREALQVEDRLIKRLRPPGNKLGNPDWEATTTWRPADWEVVPRFQGKTRAWGIVGASALIPIGTVLGAWQPPTSVFLIMCGITAIMARRAWMI